MAKSPDTTLLRAIAAAGDRERTGALDVEWEGALASVFFMFGHPSHVVFERADGRKLDGADALDAVLKELPTDFRVAPWRRAMVTDDTLHCSAEDLMGLFQRRASVDSNGSAAAADEEVAAPATVDPEPPPAADLQVPPAPGHLPFGFADFPLLPLGTVLWSDAAAKVVNLEAVVPHLPDSLLVLTGPDSQGAALIAGGVVVDAVWVNASDGLLGQAAAEAVMGSSEGTLTSHRIDDPRLVTALPLLWRAPRLGAGLPAAWLQSDDIVAEVRTSGRSCALLVDSADPGAALFDSGDLVAVYTAGHPWPATSMAALRGLLHATDAVVTVIGEAAEEPVAPAATAGEAIATTDVGEDTAPDTTPTAEAPDIAEDAASESATAEAPDIAADTAPDTATAEAPDIAEDATSDTATAEAAVDAVEAPNAATEAEESDLAEPAPAEAEAVDAHPADASDAPPSGEVADHAAGGKKRFQPAVFSIASLSPESAAEPTDTEQVEDREVTETEQVEAHETSEMEQVEDREVTETEQVEAHETSEMEQVEAREATEFVPARLDIDVDALRTDLTNIAVLWLGTDDAAPVSEAIDAARPGVDDFVSAIAAIGAMEIPGHETAVVRAMAREMHYHATEVLCGV